MNQILESQQTPHTSPSRVSHGVFIVRIWWKIAHILTAPRCIWIYARILEEYDVLQKESTLHCFPGAHYFNPLRAKFFRGDINIYLHFMSLLHIDMTQVVEIRPQISHEPTYST